jgi:hypothetical protein
LSAAEREKVIVHVKYRGVEQTFTGNVNDVWVGVNRFFAEMIPAFDVIGKVLLTVDLKELIDDCRDVIAVTPEGPTIVISKKMLTDSETLALLLLSAYVGHKMGLLDHDALAKEALVAELGKSSKITSTRLGELCREGWAARTEEGQYRLTTLGIKRLQDEVLPKARTRSEA